MITPGQKPDLRFTLPIVRGGVAKEMAFGDLLKRRTIVSVYMKNNTPSCDRQNDSLAAHAATFDRAGYDLIAVSRDTGGSQAKYAAKKAITYTLVSDPDDRFAQATDSLVEKSMYGKTFVGPARAAYVLDRDGTVLAVVKKVDTADHAAQLLDVIKKL
ncbi:MAG: redoxin domain-containing protein [Opitutaceae bacterium]|nr:redoxin domain-containing protein [Opitutaceae bacterium]